MLFSAAPRTTAAYWLRGRMLGAHFDRSKHSVYDAVNNIQQSGLFSSSVSPESHAVQFYMLNHTATVIGQRFDALEPLPADQLAVVQNYDQVCSRIAQRLFWYVLLITTREARHNKSDVSTKLSVVAKEVQQDYPDCPTELVERMFKFTKTCPDASSILPHMLVPTTQAFPLGPFCRMLKALYYKCSWHSAYGGPKWGVIADALWQFVCGKWSAEMFADTAFTLAHNTAPIFNKGMLYSHPGSHLIEILDVQRAGMIPSWVAFDPSGSGYQDALFYLCQKAVPDLFADEVDWDKVKALGAIGHYAKKSASKPPVGCVNKKIAVDHANSVWVLAQRAA